MDAMCFFTSFLDAEQLSSRMRKSEQASFTRPISHAYIRAYHPMIGAGGTSLASIARSTGGGLGRHWRWMGPRACFLFLWTRAGGGLSEPHKPMGPLRRHHPERVASYWPMRPSVAPSPSSLPPALASFPRVSSPVP